jgi:hypothetical protein
MKSRLSRIEGERARIILYVTEEPYREHDQGHDEENITTQHLHTAQRKEIHQPKNTPVYNT